jgi:hypothetical protein
VSISIGIHFMFRGVSGEWFMFIWLFVFVFVFDVRYLYCILLYTYIYYYIILSYYILYYTLLFQYPSPLSSVLLFHLPYSFSSQIHTDTFLSIFSPLFPNHLPILSFLFIQTHLQSPHSFYTCRWLVLLIYILSWFRFRDLERFIGLGFMFHVDVRC